MFESKELIYIQMQKTGCTHIASLLSDLFDGTQTKGKHNGATQEQIESDKFFISSIRNPWDWYLSLWTYGVQGEGGLWGRLTQRVLFPYLKTIAFKPKSSFLKIRHELFKDVNFWRPLYHSSDDIDAFRKWISLINQPIHSFQLGEGYDSTTLPNLCGYMTYRYFYLCCRCLEDLKDLHLMHYYSNLVEFDERNCYIDYFIRQESLEDDFCNAVEKVRSLTQTERDRIYSAKKTNTSKRVLTISDYYDAETIDIVHNREKLLVDKFDYAPPVLNIEATS